MFARLLIASLLLLPIYAEDLQIYKMRVTGASPYEGHVLLVGDQLIFFDTARTGNSFVIRRSDLKSVRDVGGTVTLESVQPFPRSTVTSYVIAMDPAQSNHVVTWFTAQPNVSVSRSRVVHQELWVDVEHKHAVGNNCRGKLIADPNTLRFESVTNAAHSQSWPYSQIASFDKYESANEVKVKPRSGEEYNFRVSGDRSAKPIYEMIASKMVTAR